jgi:hypothetical protein
MAENNDAMNKNRVTTKTLGKAVRNVLTFPFRLFRFLVKWAFRVAFRVVLAVLVVGLLCVAIRGAFPMNMPEARGMTYYQFLGHRLSSIKDSYSYTKAALIGLTIFVFEPIFYFIGAVEIPFCELYPDSQFTKWVTTKLTNPETYAYLKPREEVTWNNLPSVLWEAWERSNWYTLVKTTKGYMPEMTYPETN